MQRHKFHDNHDGTARDACGADASHRPANDERSRTGCRTAQCASGFEDEDAEHEGPFGVVEFVDGAEEGVEDCAGEHVCGAVPVSTDQNDCYLGYVRSVCECRSWTCEGLDIKGRTIQYH